MEREIEKLLSLLDNRFTTNEYPEEMPTGILTQENDGNGKCCHTCECYFDNKSGFCCI